MLCPNCTQELKKNPKHGEGVWYCTCGETWFILNIPTLKYLKPKKKPKKESKLKRAIRHVKKPRPTIEDAPIAQRESAGPTSRMS